MIGPRVLCGMAAVALAACSSAPSSPSATSSSSAVSHQSSTTGAPSGGATGSVTSERTTFGSGSSSTNEPGEGGGSYCTNAALLSPAIRVLVGRRASPTATGAAAQTFRMGGGAVTRVLPDELRSAYATAVRIIDAYIVALAAVSYDPSRVRPADAAPLSTHDTAAALATIRTYDAQTCNIV